MPNFVCTIASSCTVALERMDGSMHNNKITGCMCVIVHQHPIHSSPATMPAITHWSSRRWSNCVHSKALIIRAFVTSLKKRKHDALKRISLPNLQRRCTFRARLKQHSKFRSCIHQGFITCRESFKENTEKSFLNMQIGVWQYLSQELGPARSCRRFSRGGSHVIDKYPR